MAEKDWPTLGQHTGSEPPDSLPDRTSGQASTLHPKGVGRQTERDWWG